MSYGFDVPDHPVIRNLERTGYPDGKEPEYPHCPACQEQECGDVYVQKDDGVVGCESCLTRQSAEDRMDCLGPGGATVCPVCGQECEDVYTDRDGDVVGCDECVTRQDPWSRHECFHERDGW